MRRAHLRREGLTAIDSFKELTFRRAFRRVALVGKIALHEARQPALLDLFTVTQPCIAPKPPGGLPAERRAALYVVAPQSLPERAPSGLLVRTTSIGRAENAA